MECALSRQRTSRILLPLGWTHHRTLDRLAGKTWRLARDRRTRQGIDQFPALNARLLSYFGNSLPYSYRIRFACDLAYCECRPRYHRLHPRKRRKVLPLSDHNSVSELATRRPSPRLVRNREANASPARDSPGNHFPVLQELAGEILRGVDREPDDPIGTLFHGTRRAETTHISADPARTDGIHRELR